MLHPSSGEYQCPGEIDLYPLKTPGCVMKEIGHLRFGDATTAAISEKVGFEESAVSAGNAHEVPKSVFS